MNQGRILRYPLRTVVSDDLDDKYDEMGLVNALARQLGRQTGITPYLSGTGEHPADTAAFIAYLQQQYNQQLVIQQQMMRQAMAQQFNVTASTGTYPWRDVTPTPTQIAVPEDYLLNNLARIRGLFFFTNMERKSPEDPKYYTCHQWSEVGDECGRCGIIISIPDVGMKNDCPITKEEEEIYDKWRQFQAGNPYDGQLTRFNTYPYGVPQQPAYGTTATYGPSGSGPYTTTTSVSTTSTSSTGTDFVGWGNYTTYTYGSSK